ncbi:hypothetical protein [Actibacterium ureilyticum]|uniref:hypothetical protein n=1 Tax=Actibacterium ureilyticum TaxID=1590614 RepID=UPI0015952E24|nr:hypothetical protein [Actibacterium ureilyticum]
MPASTFYGSKSDDTLDFSLQTGGVLVSGKAGADTITGSSFDDRLMGGDGGDLIAGGAGDDTLTGGTGDDILTGGAGQDAFTIGGKTEFVDASASGESDLITDFELGVDVLTLRHVAGVPFLRLRTLDDMLALAAQDPAFTITDQSDSQLTIGYDDGTASRQIVVRFATAPPADANVHDFTDADEKIYLNAKGAAADIRGSQHDDYLIGTDGGDLINGNDGKDKIAGGIGSDTMTGGEGADGFLFGGRNTFFDAAQDGDIDRITDFEFGTDSLSFRNVGGKSLYRVSSLEDLFELAEDDSRFSVTEGDGQVTIDYSDGTGATAIVLETPGAQTAAPEFLLMVSAGQSLSVGVTYWPDRGVVTDTAVDPTLALALDFGNDRISGRGWLKNEVDSAAFQGFQPLQEHETETHASGMVQQVLDGYAADGLSAPTIGHFHAGTGGVSILQLMTSQSDLYASTDAALAATATGQVFVVQNDSGAYDHFVNNAGQADFYASFDAAPMLFDNFRIQLELAVEEAQAQGYDLLPTLALTYIQGQADTHLDHATFGYQYLLETYFQMVDAVADASYGTDVDTLISLSQMRGYGEKEVSISQIETIVDNENVHFGTSEFQFQASNPSKIGSDYTHLSPEGYHLMGQSIGAKWYDVLSGSEDAPILIESVRKTSATTLEVTFSGVEGQLIADSSAFSAAAGVSAPDNFGFDLYNSAHRVGSGVPDIVHAEITGDSEVTLEFDADLDGDFVLYLGRYEQDLSDGSIDGLSLNRFGGTTLRDSEADAFSSDAAARATEADIHEYIPTQYYELMF